MLTWNVLSWFVCLLCLLPQDASISEIVDQMLHPDVNGLILDLTSTERDQQDFLTILEALQQAPIQETHPGGYVLMGVSTVLTWNQTQKSSKKSNKESAYRNRRCSPRYKSIRYLEGLVLNAQKDGLQSYVVAPGILYGAGEHEFHHLFKEAWMHAGERTFEGLPVIGDGKNIIPTIHVYDLCSILRMLLESPPTEQQYFVAVDSGHTTQKALVSAISTGIADGKLKMIEKMDEKVLLAASIASAGTPLAPEEATASSSSAAASSSSSSSSSTAAQAAAPAVTPAAIHAANALTNGNPEIILADMKFESDFLAGLTMEWVCEQGPAASPEVFETIRQEYVKARNLKPVRVWLTGGPGSGKSYYAARLAREYYIPHVKLGEVIAQALATQDELAERLQAALAESDKQLKANKKAKEKAKAKASGSGPGSASASAAGKANKKSNAPNAPIDLALFDTDQPRLPAYLLSKVVKAYVRQPLCRNKGFVLDGFPRTAEESRWFFSPDVEEDAETGEPLTKIEDRRANAIAAAMAGEEEEEPQTNELQEAQPRDPTTMVDAVVVIACSYELAAERMKSLSPNDVIPGHSDEDGFKRRWARHSAIFELGPNGLPLHPSVESLNSPVGFVQDSIEVLELPEQVAAAPDEAIKLLRLYITKRGPSANYHPTEEELSNAAGIASDAARRAEAEAIELEKHHRSEEIEHRTKANENHALRRAAVLLEDAMLIEASSAPIRSYLMENVIPALVDGLLDVCKVQPDDPVDYLAEYLFKYSVDVPLDQENAQDRPQL